MAADSPITVREKNSGTLLSKWNIFSSEFPNAGLFRGNSSQQRPLIPYKSSPHDGWLVRTSVRHRMKRKQGRVTERSRTVREEKREKKKILFTGNVCASWPAC